MTGSSSVKRTSLCLLALLLSCLSSGNILVVGEPEPIPSELLYSERFIKNAENLILLNKLKLIEEKKDMAEREKALDDEEMVIQSMLEARAKTKTRIQPGDYSVEELPTPNAVISQAQRSGKRTAISYMTLCHFKICNMGRKRQLHK
ncbi:PREDICTED: uncharacterized protein LOC108574873 [Habropoda laboriosa]|uniref:uncharacterized protein LOC108574873 n=1 Tax=Habropoda laboriosa TaxID=597456 RepID=UPI00083E26AC|nr:PREDICTED: uncharacterized protein LOC108574873 [Habropoda laboriosa]XP_017793011.1 PREDICTED: uncharacterized protein LOC108574873 [Habropoda laboriosa]